MSTLGNILWFVLGGFFMGLGWWLAGALAFLSIIGIPWGRACFVIGQFTFFPFGKEAIDREELSGKRDIGTGVLGLLGNIVWFVLAGWWLALGHLMSAVACFASVAADAAMVAAAAAAAAAACASLVLVPAAAALWLASSAALAADAVAAAA